MKAKCIMVQGTTSSAGKSIVTAGLCRIFKQDGFKVAPFKSQNMALNSFITRDGKEMGRAQVLQAEAAGVEPSADMNPILLKPTTDKKAQVIINGEIYRNMSAVEYHEFKPRLKGMVRDAYERLASQNDVIVIEGAGSPAEINLRGNDLVNMGMAEIADAPVVLVGDIDRGGVFASLAGTMLLLDENEKARVRGVIINKFRGDVEILKPGIKMLEDIINMPVLGVIPYLRLNLDDEDSLAERFDRKSGDTPGDTLDIAVIRLPHISNFTDFNALEHLGGIRLRYVEDSANLKKPDMIVIPGSKNTIEDLAHIRKSGIENEILRNYRQGTVLFGICGGYQMLGMEITDPHSTESSLGKIEGMGLLNVKTEFREKKVTTQVRGRVTGEAGLLQGLEGMRVNGYEIHMGITDCLDGCTVCITEDTADGGEYGRALGCANMQGTVFGTYMHGIFDNMEFTSNFINNIRKMKGYEAVRTGAADYGRIKEDEIDRLAGALRKNLDMAKIYEIVGIAGRVGI